MKFAAIVVKVVDGDTCDVLVDCGFRITTKQRIRLARIDTPDKGEPGYTEATQELERLMLNQGVLLDTSKPSKYGYFLGEFYVGDKSVNQEMLDGGFAKVWV